MKNFLWKLLYSSLLTFLLPLHAHAAIVTGGLSYDSTTGEIQGTNGLTYLAADVLAGNTYAETLAATSAGGAYEQFEIAGVSQGYDFYNLATGAGAVDTENSSDFFHSPLSLYVDGDVGNNFNIANDIFLFTGDVSEIGIVTFIERSLSGAHASIEDSWGTIGVTRFTLAAGGSVSQNEASWLLYRDTPEPVPVPAAAWLMGSGLLGLLSFRRKNKAQVVAA